MNKIVKSAIGCVFAISSAAVLAAGGGAPEITSGARVTVSNNKATRVVAGGANVALKGKLPFIPGAEVNAAGETNVNSLVVSNGGKIAGQVTIDKNEATDIYNIGGSSVNVNSVVLK